MTEVAASGPPASPDPGEGVMLGVAQTHPRVDHHAPAARPPPAALLRSAPGPTAALWPVIPPSRAAGQPLALELVRAWGAALVLTAASSLSMLVGGATGAWLGGLRRWNILGAGVGVITNGAMGLVAARLGYDLWGFCGILQRAS